MRSAADSLRDSQAEARVLISELRRRRCVGRAALSPSLRGCGGTTSSEASATRSALPSALIAKALNVAEAVETNAAVTG